jgi:hypothetical protein
MKTRFVYNVIFILSFVMVIQLLHIQRHRFSPAPALIHAPAPLPPPQTRLKKTDAVVCFVVTFMRSTDPQKVHADARTAAMYSRLPSVLPLLAKTASSPDHDTYIWLREGNPNSTVIDNITVNEHGTPLISSLFEQAEERCPASVPFIAYANADILFDSGLMDTLQMLKEWPTQRLMVVGRRSNVDMANLHQASLDDVLTTKGDLFMEWAQDYFITTR